MALENGSPDKRIKRFHFDLKMFSVITVDAESEDDARTKVNAIVARLELVDHERDGTLALDLENGADLVEIEEIGK